jgi:hypothetical protein
VGDMLAAVIKRSKPPVAAHPRFASGARNA